MSSGSSSQVAACFSVERTKYLMLSKSMPDEVGAPGRQRLLAEQPQALEPQVEHPLRLGLLRRDVADDLLGQPALGGGAGDVGVGPAELVAGQLLDLLVLGQGHARVLSERSRVCWMCPGVPGMWVVQTPSPWAMVASRWTWVPSSRSNARVSASHSCGNSAATCATGQWCWQSWPPGARPGAPRQRSPRRSARRPGPRTRSRRGGRADRRRRAAPRPRGSAARRRRRPPARRRSRPGTAARPRPGRRTRAGRRPGRRR